MKNKLEEFVNALEKSKDISFYLYNVEYRVTKIENNNYLIEQFGTEHIFNYSSLNDLFNKFIIYGDSLKDYIHDIKIVK